VAYMPSDAMFYEGVTGRELFSLCGKFGKVPFEKIEELCKFLELDMSKKVSELSLGNRKKVSIIQAIMREVEVLILDEPTSGLDPLMQERFFELVLEKQKQGVTVFLSSHNLTEIEKYCDSAIIIKDGKIIDEIDMKNSDIRKGQIVSYETKAGEKGQFEHLGEANDLIKKLEKIDLVHVEIRNKSVEDEFIKYYQEDK
ncbi:MAG: AAA family ATPase, partial [Eubacteriales bacterium]